MTTLPGWTRIPSDELTPAAYDALPEEVGRRIEVVDGQMILLVPPRRSHQRIVRRLADALEAACGTDLAVDFDVALRLRDVPLLNRRPDVVVYGSVISDDGLAVFRYRLDPTTRIYASAGISTDKLTVSDPFPVSVDLTELI